MRHKTSKNGRDILIYVIIKSMSWLVDSEIKYFYLETKTFQVSTFCFFISEIKTNQNPFVSKSNGSSVARGGARVVATVSRHRHRRDETPRRGSLGVVFEDVGPVLGLLDPGL